MKWGKRERNKSDNNLGCTIKTERNAEANRLRRMKKCREDWINPERNLEEEEMRAVRSLELAGVLSNLI
jgi:hypothetical protein